MIVNNDDLINMAPVYSNHDLRGLRQLYDLVEVHVRGVKAQEVRLIVSKKTREETGN